MNKKDLVGSVFGCYRVVQLIYYKPKSQSRWLCLCTVCDQYSVRSSTTLNKNPKQCFNCRRSEKYKPELSHFDVTAKLNKNSVIYFPKDYNLKDYIKVKKLIDNLLK